MGTTNQRHVAAVGRAQQRGQFDVRDEVRCEQLRRQQDDAHAGAGECVLDAALPDVACFDVRVRPELQLPLPDERHQQDEQLVTPLWIRVPVTHENEIPNAADGYRRGLYTRHLRFDVSFKATSDG